MHATCMRACACMCVYKLRFVRVAFSISHTPGGHLPPEAKSRFGRAWLSIMYNRDTSAPWWDCCLPSTCLAFRPAECRRLCPPGRSTLRLGCRARIRQPIVLLCPPLALLPFMPSLSDGPRWLHVTYLLRRDRGECLPLRLLTRKPFVSRFFRSTRSDSFFSGTTHKDAGAFSTLFLFFRQILPY